MPGRVDQPLPLIVVTDTSKEEESLPRAPKPGDRERYEPRGGKLTGLVESSNGRMQRQAKGSVAQSSKGGNRVQSEMSEHARAPSECVGAATERFKRRNAQAQARDAERLARGRMPVKIAAGGDTPKRSSSLPSASVPVAREAVAPSPLVWKRSEPTPPEVRGDVAKAVEAAGHRHAVLNSMQAQQEGAQMQGKTKPAAPPSKFVGTARERFERRNAEAKARDAERLVRGPVPIKIAASGDTRRRSSSLPPTRAVVARETVAPSPLAWKRSEPTPSEVRENIAKAIDAAGRRQAAPNSVQAQQERAQMRGEAKHAGAPSNFVEAATKRAQDRIAGAGTGAAGPRARGRAPATSTAAGDDSPAR